MTFARAVEFEPSIEEAYRRCLPADVLNHSAPFINPQWSLAIVPDGVQMSRDEFERIAVLGNLSGDSIFWITPVDGPIGGLAHTPTLECPWSYTIFKSGVTRNQNYYSFPCAFFGPSGAWSYLTFGTDFGLLGGDPRLMDHYLRMVGGLETLAMRSRELVGVIGSPLPGSVISRVMARETFLGRPSWAPGSGL